ncbi:MAG TPA: type II secretion system protein GspM [Gaiellaceae bacterium]|nr:type II secretion system protein GspM [Gaiellaceae bacterium]
MTARLASLSTRAQVAVVAAALVLVAVIGYFALISPKNSTAASLKKQTAAVQAQITANRSTAFAQALPAVRSATIFGLTQAMPSQLDTPDVILTLSGLAQDSGLSFDQIQPGVAQATAGAVSPDPFAAEPIQVKFNGSFYSMLTFLQRLRNLVRVQNGRLFTAGRLFDVTNVTFAEGTQGWPQVQATLTIDAFVPQAPQAAAVVPGATTTTGTTPTTTTTTSTTTSNPTSAAPSTSGGTS